MTLQSTLKRSGAAAHYHAAEARHRAGDLDGALIGYDAALALEPLHGPSLHLSAMAHFQRGELAAALARIEAATRVLSLHDGVSTAYGVILMALDRPIDAVRAYQRGLTLAPDDGALWFNLGLAQRGLGQLDAAIEAFSAAATKLGGAVAHHELGLSLQMAGRAGEAVGCYGAALGLGAGADTALNAGAACYEVGDVAAAENYYRLALELDPGCAKAMNNLAVIAQDAGDHEQASELLSRAIALNPAFEDAHNNLGVSRLRLGDAEGALGAYRAALEVNPFSPKALANLTELLFEQDQAGAALAHHRAAAAAHPGQPRAWLELARTLERAEDFAGAFAALHRAENLDDRLWETPHRLGELHQRTGDLESALAQHRRACGLAPDEPEAWRQFALAAVKAGDGETALPALSHLLRLDPFDPQGWACRALALRLTGQTAAAEANTARDDLVAVIPLAPPTGYPDLTAFLQALNADLAAVNLRAWSPRGQSVIGGFQTQNDLFDEPAPAIQALKASIDAAVAAYLANPGEATRAFIPEAPRRRRYRSWSVTMKAGGHHAPHIHPEGRLSGVYYVDIPHGEGSGDVGGLEFGRPGFVVPLASPPPTRVILPRPGNLVLFPSYLWHGTQTFSAPGDRTTVAFDLLR